MHPAVSRLLALILLIVTLAAAYLLVAEPVRAKYENLDDTMGLLGQQLRNYRDMRGQEADLKKQLDMLTKMKASEGNFLQGASETLIGADLQNTLKTMVQTANGTMRSVQTLPSAEDEDFRRVAVRAQMALSNEALLRVLHEIEAAKPYLFIDNLEVRSQNQRRRRGQPEPVIQLFVSVDVYGYIRPEQP